MSLKLIPPRAGKTKYWYVRGSYGGIAIDRSTKVAERPAARTIFKRWQKEIELGVYRQPEQIESAPETFAGAAAAYMSAGGEVKFMAPILADAIANVPLRDVTQVTLDEAAARTYPNATAQTRNRQFYTPVSAVLRRAGVRLEIKRPKGWRGNASTSWLEPDQAFRAFAAADEIDREFGVFLRLLCYTGMRLSEALGIRLRNLSLAACAVYLPHTKNGEARTVFLPPVAISALAGHPRGLDRHTEARLFRFHPGGRLRGMLKETWRRAGVSFPRRQAGFHVFCHTYGTWMYRFAALDTFGLTRTQRWKDPKSADRYRHTAVSEEAKRALLLPAPPAAEVVNGEISGEVASSKTPSG